MQALWMLAGSLAFSVMDATIKLLMASDYGAFERVFWHPVALRDVPALQAIGALAAIGQLCMTRAFGRGRTLLAANLQFSGARGGHPPRT